MTVAVAKSMCKWLTLLLILPAWSLPAWSVTPQELIDQGRLLISTSIAPDQPLVPGQKGRLHIQLETDHWFSGGTRITAPEVPGLIVLQTEMFASNSSEMRRGQNWVVQQWTLDVYATDAGNFNTGPIRLQVKVATDNGIAEGLVSAPSVSIHAALPAALADTGQWLAASAFSVNQHFSPERIQLQPGDAITRTITLKAEDVLDKMLPLIDFDQQAHQQTGLAIYPHPPELSSKNNRGKQTVQSVQEVTYLAEKAGHYHLPAYRFAWWNTKTGELHELKLNGMDIEVTGSAPQTTAPPPEKNDRWRQWLPDLIKLSALLFSLLLLYWLIPWQGLRQSLAVLYRRAGSAWKKVHSPALPSRINPWP